MSENFYYMLIRLVHPVIHTIIHAAPMRMSLPVVMQEQVHNESCGRERYDAVAADGGRQGLEQRGEKENTAHQQAPLTQATRLKRHGHNAWFGHWTPVVNLYGQGMRMAWA